MRYLRLYSQDASFKADEINAGGTGNDVEAMVPCIVKTADLKKMYFNPHDKTVQFHTLTIYYENSKGEQLAEYKTMRVKYISGVSQEIVVTPKNIDGYIAKEEKIVANIPEDTSIVFRYKLKLDYNRPLTFNIISAGTIYWRMQTISASDRKTIEYRKNGGEWASITSDAGTPSPNISVNAGDVVEFRGDNPTYCPANGTNYRSTFASSTAVFEVEGNIMSLIKSRNFARTTTLASSYTFYDLFEYCTGLTSAEKLILPATTLASNCYGNMFYNCTNLTTAPELPATTLAYGCYSNMFNGCTSLTTAPELPATTLAGNCYAQTFYKCTNLTTAPSILPATTLTSSCYYGMFWDCSSLTTAPELSAIALASNCCSNMFRGCTSLTTAPSILPATTLTEWCYQYMFQGCTSLTTAPELPATILVYGCYYNMFSGCSSLNYIKCLATDISATYSRNYWVAGVASAGTFVKDANMLSWTTGESGIPSKWVVKDYGFKLSRPIITLSEIASAKTITITSSFNNWTATTNDDWYGLSQYTGDTGDTVVIITANTQNTNRTGTVTFTDGTNVETLTVNEKYLIETPLTFNIISSGTIYWKATDSAYSGKIIQYKLNNGEWNSITSVVQGNYINVKNGDVLQFKGDTAAYSSGYARYNFFSGSTTKFEAEGNIMSLVDSENFATTTTLASSYTFAYLFWKCTALTSTENLVVPATTLADFCYAGMFSGCTNLTAAPSALPATTLTKCCYIQMFQGCTSLTSAPALPATTLADSCYKQMFYRCTSLTAAPELPATTLVQSCYDSMFWYSSNLNYIKCLATDISAGGCTGFWVNDISQTGTFIKDASMTHWTRGYNGIPFGWTVQDAS